MAVSLRHLGWRHAAQMLVTYSATGLLLVRRTLQGPQENLHAVQSQKHRGASTSAWWPARSRCSFGIVLLRDRIVEQSHYPDRRAAVDFYCSSRAISASNIARS